MTTFQKAALLKSLQKLDWEMRTRHYAAVIEAEPAPAERVRYIERQSEEECYGDAEEFFLDQQSPSDATFR